MDRGMAAGKAAAAALLDPDPASKAIVAMTALLAVLNDAGCLVEPPPPAPEMTVEDAARLLIRRARTPKLEADDPVDVAAVADIQATFEYAWACAQRVGIEGNDIELHTARQLLLAHHGLR